MGYIEAYAGMMRKIWFPIGPYPDFRQRVNAEMAYKQLGEKRPAKGTLPVRRQRHRAFGYKHKEWCGRGIQRFHSMVSMF